MRRQTVIRARYNKKRKLRKKPLGSCVIYDHTHMIERINTVKLCGTGFESHPNGVDLQCEKECSRNRNHTEEIYQERWNLNTSWRSTKLCLLNFPLILDHERLNRHFFLWWNSLFTVTNGDRDMTSTGKTLTRLGNITMRGSAERIYTTTYYIPSSPTEVRVYTPILPQGMTQRSRDSTWRSHDPRII